MEPLDLDINLDLDTIGRPGRKPKATFARCVGPVTAEDLAMLAVEGETKPPAIKRLSERHHQLARLLASGMSESEAGFITGYSASRVSILKGDAAFGELLIHYRDQANAQFAQVFEHMSGFSMDILLELRERFEADPEKFSPTFLLELFTKMADRTGHGPSSQQTVIVDNIGDRIEAARQRAKAAALAAPEDATVIESSPVPPTAA